MYPIVELRQYTLVPGARETLIELFDREFVESQEAAGMAVLGQFRDLDDPDRFVWLRGFTDMAARAEALARFYGGPVWKAHSAAANATMLDSDNVLLLRTETSFPRAFGPGRSTASAARLRRSGPEAEGGVSAVLVTLQFQDRPFDYVPADDGLCLRTEYAENTFPALPVRTGEHVFVRIERFPDVATLDDHLTHQRTTAQYLRLTPTARSLLR